MPNDAAAEKAGSAEHGDGAIVRCQHDSDPPIHVESNSAKPAQMPRRTAILERLHERERQGTEVGDVDK